MTYNGFRDVLFWDVIQALTKIYMIRLVLKKQEIYRKRKLNDESISE
jgi:hypothetical protein